jgi:hypothetical protein
VTSWPLVRIPVDLVSQSHFGLSVRVKPTLPKVGSWSPAGLSKTQSSIVGVKSPHIWVFWVSLKRSWSLDVQNGLVLVIWTSAAQVMGKRRAGSQTASSRRALWECDMALESSLRGLQVWFRPRPDRRLGRGATKSQSPESPNQDSFGTPLWESREKKPFGCHSRGRTQNIL